MLRQEPAVIPSQNSSPHTARVNGRPQHSQQPCTGKKEKQKLSEPGPQPMRYAVPGQRLPVRYTTHGPDRGTGEGPQGGARGVPQGARVPLRGTERATKISPGPSTPLGSGTPESSCPLGTKMRASERSCLTCSRGHAPEGPQPFATRQQQRGTVFSPCQCSTVQYCAVKHTMVQYSTVQYSIL